MQEDLRCKSIISMIKMVLVTPKTCECKNVKKVNEKKINKEKNSKFLPTNKNGQYLLIWRKMLTSAKNQHMKIKVMVQNDFFYTILQWCQILERKNKYSKGYDILKLHSFGNNAKNFALKNTI